MITTLLAVLLILYSYVAFGMKIGEEEESDYSTKHANVNNEEQPPLSLCNGDENHPYVIIIKGENFDYTEENGINFTFPVTFEYTEGNETTFGDVKSRTYDERNLENEDIVGRNDVMVAAAQPSQPCIKSHRARAYECKYCGEHCWSLRHYEAHGMLKHRAKDEKLFHCEECGCGFNFKRILDRHTIYTHGNRKPTIPCVYCRKLFFTGGGKKRHEKSCGKKAIGSDCSHIRHSDEIVERALVKDNVDILCRVRKFECEHCGEQYGSLRRYEAHGKSKHKTKYEKLFRCEECGRGFNFKRCLDRHLNFAHGKGNPTILCKHCHRPFFTSVGKNKHEKSCGKKMIPSSIIK